jgi:hypothetical protein
MSPLRPGRLLTAAIVCLLVGGILTSALVIGESRPSQTQLTALVSAAEGSRTYAYSVVDFAASHDLSVSAAQSQLTQGDSLLEGAQADAQSGTNTSAGIQLVQAAMRDYTHAAAAASLAINNAGLSASPDYSVAEDAIAEVNSSVAILASVSVDACAQLAVSTSSSSPLAQACSEAAGQVSAARASLNQAAALASQANGQAGANASYSQVLSLVAAARSDVSSTQSEIVTISSYGYAQRAGGYVSSVIEPLSAKANSTIAAEMSANASYASFRSSYDAYAQTQASSTTNIDSKASALATAVADANAGAVVSSAGTAEGVESKVASDLAALLALPGLSAYPNVISDITAAQASAGSFKQAASAAGSEGGAYSQTQLQSFSSYLNTFDQDQASVQTSGTTYVSACQSVETDLSGLLQIIPGISAILADLNGLQISGSVGGLESSMSDAASAMIAVQSDIGAYTTAVATQSSSVAMSAQLSDTAASAATDAETYINSSGAYSASQAESSVQAVAKGAASYLGSANSSAHTTVGAYASSEEALVASGTALEGETSASAASVTAVAGYLGSDLQARVSEAATGQADIASALQSFSSLNVSEGAALMGQGSLDLQSASTVNAQ